MRSHILCIALLIFFISSCGSEYSNTPVEATNTSILNKAWEPATLLENITTVDVRQSEVAIDDRGNAFVVWCESANTWVVRYSAADNKWNEAKILIPNNRTISSYLVNTQPDVALDASGNAMIVWLESGDVPWHRVWAMKYSADSDSWGLPILVETNYVSGNAKNPRVLVDKSGNFAVIWAQDDRQVSPIRSHIWANRYSAASQSWGVPKMIDNSPYSEKAGELLQAAVDGAGNIIVVWRELNFTKNTAYANRYSAIDDKWGTPTLLKTSTMNGVFNLQVAVDKHGNAVAVWEEDDSNTGVVYSRRYVWINRYFAETEKWGMSHMIPPIQSADMINPQVVIDDNGNASIVGCVSNNARYYLWEANYDFKNDSISLPKIFVPYDGLIASLAVDNYGNKLAVFAVADGHSNVLSMTHNSIEGAWASTIQIGGENGWSGGYVKLAINNKGNAVTTWAQSDGLKYHLWGSVLK